MRAEHQQPAGWRASTRAGLTLSALFTIAGVANGTLAQPASDRDPGVEVTVVESVDEPIFGQEIALFDPSGRALEPLHRALRRAEAGEGQARLTFYGASHVAADFFTHVVRAGLQERFGDAGHGLILPARPWRRYRHLGGVSVESSRAWDGLRVRASTREPDALGVAGIAVEGSSRRAWGRIDTGDQAVSRFEIHYLRQPGGGTFDLHLDGRRVQRISTGSESIGPGVYELRADDRPHVLEVRLRGDGPVRLFGASLEREAPGVIVDTLGINGARANSHLSWDETLHTTYLRRLAPDLVVLAYGTNESGDTDQPIDRYESELRSVIARIRGTTPAAACLLIGPSDRPLRDGGEHIDRPRTHEVVEVQRRVSRDFGCAFFDLVAFSGGPLSMVTWASNDPPYAQSDLVHFTVRGYQRLGEVLLGALLDGFESHSLDEDQSLAAR